jgi:hypothetical protein
VIGLRLDSVKDAGTEAERRAATDGHVSEPCYTYRTHSTPVRYMPHQ